MMEMEGPLGQVERWFKARGFQPLELDELDLRAGKPDMAFEGPQGTVFVVFVGREAIGNRSYFADLLMRASRLRGKCNFLYLATPKVVAPFMDVEVLRKHAIGLLVLGDEGVIEALASPYKPVEQAGPAQEVPEGLELLNDVLSRLSAIEQRLSALEGEVMGLRPLAGELKALRGLREQVRKLSARLDVLSRRVDSLSAGLAAPAPPTRPVTAPSPPAPTAPELEGLPSFFKDNPWLEILARRGQGEVPA